eukprot:1157482-Pelagomonas_calceolata.AAC.6
MQAKPYHSAVRNPHPAQYGCCFACQLCLNASLALRFDNIHDALRLTPAECCDGCICGAAGGEAAPGGA